jgi:hypothetical protein
MIVLMLSCIDYALSFFCAYVGPGWALLTGWTGDMFEYIGTQE